jgi:hypothetical protein
MNKIKLSYETAGREKQYLIDKKIYEMHTDFDA